MPKKEATAISTIECCMCGDYGLPYELFQCKSCLFRSQHRYCSNVYPRAKSYQVCNWCLDQKTNSTATTSSLVFSTNSSNNTSPPDNKNKKTINISSRNCYNYVGGLSNKEQQIKQRSSTDQGKRINGLGGCINNNSDGSSSTSTRRMKSDEADEIPNRSTGSRMVMNNKKLFRGKVQRYKLLEEVCN